MVNFKLSHIYSVSLLSNSVFRKSIKNGKIVHDEYYKSLNLSKPVNNPPSNIKEVPYKQTQKTSKFEQIRNYQQKQMENEFGNVLRFKQV